MKFPPRKYIFEREQKSKKRLLYEPMSFKHLGALHKKINAKVTLQSKKSNLQNVFYLNCF